MSYIGSKPANKPVVASDIDPTMITGQTALAVAPAATDEFLISDAGTLKRLDASLVGNGKVLQVVQTFKATSFSSTATSFTDVTDLSVAITPSSSSSKILVFCIVTMSADADAIIQLLRGSTVIGSGTSGTTTNGFAQLAATGNVFTNSVVPLCVNYLDSPSTTSATTYKILMQK